MRLALTLVSFASASCVALATGNARADDCPDGDWFCEPAERPEPPPGPAPDAAPGERPDRMQLDRPRMHRERRMVFEPRPPPRHRPRRHLKPVHPWGFDAHVFGALLGEGRDSNRQVSMGGLGVGLRYRLLPEFAVSGEVELGFGTDYNGYDRQEAALLVHAIGTVNPRSVVRVFFLGGFGLSSARVTVGDESSSPLWPSRDEHYGYFGLDLGAGVEVGLSPRTAIHGELIGFVRDRTDAGLNSAPEFVDSDSGRTTNSSGGGLLRFGAVFYW
jgi:hypothetical protein